LLQFPRLTPPARLRLTLAVGALAATIAATAASPAAALTIIPNFDSSVTGLANAAAVESAFRTVANDYASVFSNPVTVNIGVSWGSVAGQALPSNAVGASSDNLYGYFSYGQVRNDLINSSRSNPSDTALGTAVKFLPASTPAGPTNYVIPSAEAKALGLVAGNSGAVDGYIGFAGATSGYDFNPADGVTAGAFDFEAVAAHEIAEVLGRIGGVDNPSVPWRTPYDLYRYSAPGKLDYGYNDAAYFSINGGSTSLMAFNNSASGGDRTDWLTNGGVNDVSNAFIAPGQAYNLSAVDLTSLDVLGWGGSNPGDTASGNPNLKVFGLVIGPDAVPEPASWATMILGFAGLGALLRRRTAMAAA
jgi:hypothetical protein